MLMLLFKFLPTTSFMLGKEYTVGDFATSPHKVIQKGTGK